MEVTRLAVGMLESEAPLAEVNLARNARVHHPLQGAVDSGPTDLLIFPANQVDKVVRTEVPFLPQEDVDDLFTLTGPLPARRLEPRQILEGGRHVRHRSVRKAWILASLDAERRSASARRDSVRILDGESASRHRIDEVDLRTAEVADAHRVDEQLDSV